MSPKKNTSVEIGQPIEELPTTPRQYEPAKHWLKVGAACLQHEGKWLPIRIGHLTLNRHKDAAADIRNGRLAAFRDWPGFDARFRDGQLYVRYVDPEGARQDDTPDEEDLPDGPLRVVGFTRGGAA